ncbi:hypothetical protein FFLO_02528 [Filobasidium floriforme]|uniref:Trimethylguanosine synthase n=1 Tax=Filobasidium floriforme TaxID=5210 RepID=A0A8K0JMT6_9TREE|nr:hypothetical protein FFLO_02528 [Filobasidium floriforme]
MIKKSWECPELVKRYTVENWEEEMPEDIKKYFHQRRTLFTRYSSHPILLDHTGWYSVTPEKIANHIADRCRCDTVLDGFAGVGGNLIAFAWTCERVIAIDTSMDRLRIARHNAMQYGVADRIEFICADYVEFVEAWARRKQRQREERGEMEAVVGLGEEVDVVFLSPPWGGTEYLEATDTTSDPDPDASFAIPNHLPAFPLSTLLPLPAKELYDLSRKMTPNIAFYLPRNSDAHEISEWADETPLDENDLTVGGKEWVEVEEEWMGCVGKKGADGKLKAITAYFGGLAGQGEA